MINKDFLKSLQNQLRKEADFSSKRKEALSKYDNVLYENTVESTKYVQAFKEFSERFIPDINTREPETFSCYGSAEKYYENSFSYIYTSYPYDGSGLEKLEWSLSASALDLAVLQHEYPKETGFVTFTPGTWGSKTATSGKYSLSDDPEYIKFSGGPYAGTLFDSKTFRESSLKIDGTYGNSIEFWLKKDSFVSAKTESEVVFDSHTIDFPEGNASHGRFLLELSASSGSPFYLTYLSGTAGLDRVQIGQDITKEMVADGKWHHYSFVVYHSGSKLHSEMYLDGKFNSLTSTSLASLGPVDGYFNGTIGALATQKNSTGGLGYGKLSASIDEFRFWKTRRTAKDVGNYYDFPVNGVTDSGSVDSSLGLYYKFNEGKVSDGTIDKVILDYSGRLNNGEFVGYSSDNRNLSSAITLSTASPEKELGDPIINPNSSKVVLALSTLTNIGKQYDDLNNSSIFKSVPQWAYEPNAGSNNLNSDFSILLQAIASRFDSIKLLIDNVPKIGRKRYDDFHFAKGSIKYLPSLYVLLGCEREFVKNFASLGNSEIFSFHNLLAKNFNVTELPIINKASLDEQFYNLKFSQTDEVNNLGSFLSMSKAKEVSDKILNSIYYDIDAIYKKKGTHAAFRNLIRCFGVDEKLVTPNVYINNGEVLLKNNPIHEETTIKSLETLNRNSEVVLYQTSSAADERYYIQGKSSGSMSFEVRTVFPDQSFYSSAQTETSIFGLNKLDITASDITVASPNNAGFVVTSVKDATTFKGSKFRLASTTGIFDTITTTYFPEVFDNTPWYLSVRFSEDTGVPLENLNTKGTKSYKVEFNGYQYELDTLVSSFSHTASITEANYLNFIQANKNVFLGAQRTNITGSTIKQTENRFLTFTVWDDRLEDDELIEHAKTSDNLGRTLPFAGTSDNDGDSVIKSDTLILNWQFDDTSMSNNKVSVIDHASGSVQRISDFGNILGYKYPGITNTVGDPSSIIDTEHLYFIRYMPIDNAIGESKIKIKEREIEFFEIDSRPVSYIYSYEKSAYQVMSRQMLRMVSGISAFNNLIGEPIYKYRLHYKSLEKLRERFFSKIENEIDIERFIEYYKWIDSSLGKMLEQLTPATSEIKVGMQDVIESHALERSKYKHQAPVFEFKDPDPNTNILGINELLYDWEHGHRPLSGEEQDNCLWWQDRAERDGALQVPGAQNDQREELRIKRNSIVSGSTYAIRKLSRPYRFEIDRQRVYSVGSNRSANKNKELYKVINSGKQIILNASDIFEFKRCDDVINPQEEDVYSAKIDTTGTDGYLDADSDLLLPFSLYSSSVGNDFSNFKENLRLTNNHDDALPALQSPFVREHLGGMPHRRVKPLTKGIDRPEAYELSASTGVLTMKQNSGPKSTISLGRENFLNISNVKTDINRESYLLTGTKFISKLAPNFGIGQSNQKVGYSVSVSDNYAIVGAPHRPIQGIGNFIGAAYILSFDGTTWIQGPSPLILTASDSGAGDQFGHAVAIDGNRVIVGAPYEDPPGGSEAGAAYVYSLQSGTWQQDAKLVADNAGANDNFGFSVAISGDTAVIGAFQEDTKANNAGSAYVFTYSDGSWSQTTMLTASDGDSFDGFGRAVAISGDVIVAGAYNDDDINASSGAAYVFTRSGGSWSQTQKLKASDPEFGDNFGLAVAIDGNVIVVGAKDEHPGGLSDAGSAYVYELSSGTWSQTAKLNAADAAADDEFALSVAVSGDNILVGAPYDDDGASSAGSVYVFRKILGTWEQVRKITASDPSADDKYGFSVAISGENVVIGSPESPKGNTANFGATYTYQRVNDSWEDITVSTLPKIGTYDKSYNIVQTSGRSKNNRLLADSGSMPITPISAGRLAGTVDYTVPQRQKTEHVFVNRFSSPGGPETMAASARDLESGEFSIYNTINYRNLSIREPLNRLYKERADKLGYRSGSTTQASIHMTNRNHFYTHELTGQQTIISLYSTNFNSDTVDSLPSVFTAQGAGPVVKANNAGNNKALSLIGSNLVIGTDSSLGNTPSSPETNESQSYYRWVELSQGFSNNNIRVAFKAYEGRLNGEYGATNAPEADDQEYLWLQYKIGATGEWKNAGPGLVPGQKGEVVDAGAWDFTNTVTRDIHAARGGDNKIFLRWISRRDTGGTANFDHWAIDDIEISTIEEHYIAVTDPDNFYIQHPIPQNDLQYAWITASSTSSPSDFVIANDGFGHQHNFTTGSKKAIQFVAESTFENPIFGQRIVPSTIATQDSFGTPISLSEEYFVVGVPFADPTGSSNAGEVYIYERYSHGRWTVSERLDEAIQPQASANFGYSVDSHANTIVVGEPKRDISGDADIGQVHVFTRFNDAWTLEQTVVHDNKLANDEFGTSVAIYGDILAVGAPATDRNQTNAGSVYIFERNGKRWTQTRELTASSPAINDRFGEHISIHNNTVAISAPTNNSSTGLAFVYIFEKKNGVWSESAKMAPSEFNGNAATGIEFGGDSLNASPRSISVYDDLLVVGARAHTSATGKAYIFQKTNDTWPTTETQILEALDASVGDQFGAAVSVYGNVIAIGAPTDHTTIGGVAYQDLGSTYIFEKFGSTWKQTNKIVPESLIEGNMKFGYSLSLGDNDLVVGAFAADTPADGGASGGSDNQGAVYTYKRHGKNWSQINTNFAGVNLNIVDSVDIDNNIISASVPATIAHLNNHRNGLHGWPTWKQIRGYEHPVAKLHKKNNIFSTCFLGSPQINQNFNSKAINFNTGGTQNSYLNINDTRAIFSQKKAISLFAWVKHPPVTEPGSHVILGVNTLSGGNSLIIGLKGDGTGANFIGPGILSLFIVDSRGQSSGQWFKGELNTRVDDNQWHHVGIVYEETGPNTAEIEFYVDGISQGSKQTLPRPFSTVISNSDDTVSIGQELDNTAASDFWDGYIADFAIWDKAMTDSEVSSLLEYSGVDSRAFGPIDLSKHSTASNLLVWYRMGDGKLNNLSDVIDIPKGTNISNRIYNNSTNPESQGLYNATPVRTESGAASATMAIEDVSAALPGDYSIFQELFIISGSDGVGMNVGSYVFDFAEEDYTDPYIRSRLITELSPDTPTAHDSLRIIKNYKESPVTQRFYPISITIHGDRSFGAQELEELNSDWSRGFDNRLPRFFKERENVQKMNQLTRERAWNLDNQYFEEITRNIKLSEETELSDLGKYSISYGQVNIKKSFQNDVTTFSNQQIMKDRLVREDLRTEFLPFMDMLIEENDTHTHKLLEISYIEKIYPREINTFTKNARERQNFKFFGWNSVRDSRNIILSGNVEHKPDEALVKLARVSAFPKYSSIDSSDFNKSFFGLYDAVDVRATSGDISIASNITASTWVLDSRKDMATYPVKINDSYLNNSSSFLSSRDQGTRGEGLLQNDFSTFPLGYNGLYGTPPFALVYNRRQPQIVEVPVFVGEWNNFVESDAGPGYWAKTTVGSSPAKTVAWNNKYLHITGGNPGTGANEYDLRQRNTKGFSLGTTGIFYGQNSVDLSVLAGSRNRQGDGNTPKPTSIAIVEKIRGNTQLTLGFWATRANIYAQHENTDRDTRDNLFLEVATKPDFSDATEYTDSVFLKSISTSASADLVAVSNNSTAGKIHFDDLPSGAELLNQNFESATPGTLPSGASAGFVQAGSATFTFSGKPNDGSTITLFDGSTTKVFEIDDDLSGVTSVDNIQVDPSVTSADAAGTATQLVAKINAQSGFGITAVNPSSGKVVLTTTAVESSTIVVNNAAHWNSVTSVNVPSVFVVLATVKKRYFQENYFSSLLSTNYITTAGGTIPNDESNFRYRVSRPLALDRIQNGTTEDFRSATFDRRQLNEGVIRLGASGDSLSSGSVNLTVLPGTGSHLNITEKITGNSHLTMSFWATAERVYNVFDGMATGLSDTDKVLQLQFSSDNTNWSDVTGLYFSRSITNYDDNLSKLDSEGAIQIDEIPHFNPIRLRHHDDKNNDRVPDYYYTNRRTPADNFNQTGGDPIHAGPVVRHNRSVNTRKIMALIDNFLPHTSIDDPPIASGLYRFAQDTASYSDPVVRVYLEPYEGQTTFRGTTRGYTFNNNPGDSVDLFNMAAPDFNQGENLFIQYKLTSGGTWTTAGRPLTASYDDTGERTGLFKKFKFDRWKDGFFTGGSSFSRTRFLVENLDKWSTSVTNLGPAPTAVGNSVDVLKNYVVIGAPHIATVAPTAIPGQGASIPRFDNEQRISSAMFKPQTGTTFADAITNSSARPSQPCVIVLKRENSAWPPVLGGFGAYGSNPGGPEPDTTPAWTTSSVYQRYLVPPYTAGQSGALGANPMSSSFGFSVAMDDTNSGGKQFVVVGAPTTEYSRVIGGVTSLREWGHVHVYRYINESQGYTHFNITPPTNGWSHNSNTATGNRRFGHTVAIQGNYLAISAPLRDYTDNSNPSNGAVFLYKYSSSGGGTWSHVQTISHGTYTPVAGAPDSFSQSSESGQYGSRWGWSLDFSGDRLAIGVPQWYNKVYGSQRVTTDLPDVEGSIDYETAAPGPGGVFIYKTDDDGDSWSQEQAIGSPNSYAFTNFGWDVSLDGNTLAVGAPGLPQASNGLVAESRRPGAGAVYIYNFSNNVWSLASSTEHNSDSRYLASNYGFRPGATEGFSVSLSGSLLAIGAPAQLSFYVGAPNAFTSFGSSQEIGSFPDSKVYLWKKVNGVWKNIQSFTEGSTKQVFLNNRYMYINSTLGTSVALNETALVVGQPDIPVRGGSTYDDPGFLINDDYLDFNGSIGYNGGEADNGNNSSVLVPYSDRADHPGVHIYQPQPYWDLGIGKSFDEKTASPNTSGKRYITRDIAAGQTAQNPLQIRIISRIQSQSFGLSTTVSTVADPITDGDDVMTLNKTQAQHHARTDQRGHWGFDNYDVSSRALHYYRINPEVPSSGGYYRIVNKLPGSTDTVGIFNFRYQANTDNNVLALSGAAIAAEDVPSNPPISDGVYRYAELSASFTEPTVLISFNPIEGNRKVVGTTVQRIDELYQLDMPEPEHSNENLYLQYKVGSGNWTNLDELTIKPRRAIGSDVDANGAEVTNDSPQFWDGSKSVSAVITKNQNAENPLRLRFISRRSNNNPSSATPYDHWAIDNLVVSTNIMHFFQTTINVPEGGAYYRLAKGSSAPSNLVGDTVAVHGFEYTGLHDNIESPFGYREKLPSYLSGEAQWEAGSGSLGPFYDSYSDYSFNDIRPIAQDHSLIPEFKISDFVEEVLKGDRPYPNGREIQNPFSYWPDFLSLTGSLYPNSSGDVSIGGQFFKTYSNSDFLKYFEVIEDDIEKNQHPMTPSRITLKCKAAMKFLPYRGLYPAERITQISELFHKNYLSSEVLADANIRQDSYETKERTQRFLDLRAGTSRYQASKPLFGPGVLMNSIKAGIAVDYPIFTGSFHTVGEKLPTALPLSGPYPDDFISPGTTFTGSIINNTADLGIPRLSGSVSTRIQFEDALNPSNLFNTQIFDNEPHPSASLQYGTQAWNKILERPSRFGTFDSDQLLVDLGSTFTNTEERFANQMSPYTLAVQNFAAETVNFFVEDGHLTTLVSKPINEPFTAGTNYKMRVRVSNINNVMYDRHSAFGPPVDDSGPGNQFTQLTLNAQPQTASFQVTFNDPSTYKDRISDETEFVTIEFANIENNPGDASDLTVQLHLYRQTAGLAVDSLEGANIQLFLSLNEIENKSQLASAIVTKLNNNSSFSQFLFAETTGTEGQVKISTTSFSAAEHMKVRFIGFDSDRENTNDDADIAIFENGSANRFFIADSVLNFQKGVTDDNARTGANGVQFSHVSNPFSGGADDAGTVYTSNTIDTTASHGYAPFVPPFLDPNSEPYVEVTFTPGQTKVYNAQEIIEASTYEYYNFHTLPPKNHEQNTNYKASMGLDASLNLGICANLRTDNLQTIIEGNPFISRIDDPAGIHVRTEFRSDENQSFDRWVIQTKWETPVLDFSNAKATSLDLTTNTTRLVSGSPWKTRFWDEYYKVGTIREGATTGSFMTGSTGMWHQKGEIIDNQSSFINSKGYFLKVEDMTEGGALGLASKLGFINFTEDRTTKALKKSKKFRNRIGAIEDRKMIKEAVVAIPYIVREDLDNRIEFVTFEESVFEKAKKNIEHIKRELENIPISDDITTIDEYKRFLELYHKNTRDFTSASPVNAIEYQLFMMEDYILPPPLDFNITGNEPFMMYFFQFRASLDKSDISNIWQNLYPDSSLASKARYSCVDREHRGRLAALNDVSYVSHYLDTLSLTNENYSPIENPMDAVNPPGSFKNKTRWMIFKVKERGKSNLEQIRKESLDPRVSNIEKFEYLKESKTSKTTDSENRENARIRSLTENKLQFNWPYDYFSFVELVKLEAKVDSYTHKKTDS